MLRGYKLSKELKGGTLGRYTPMLDNAVHGK